LESFYQLDKENSALRGGNKHIFSIGIVSLEIVPTSKNESLEDVFKLFIKFAKELKKLHGNEHLVARVLNGEGVPTPIDQMMIG
tara:strand:+ start:93 stop:344 length:252 start_codon:yes stop_codon:yes gene_type:complete